MAKYNLAKNLERIYAAEKRVDTLRIRLANKRLEIFTTWFKQTYPRWDLTICFGNGNEWGTIIGREWYPGYYDTDEIVVQKRNGGEFISRVLRPLAEAIRDIRELTDGYTGGCPDDVKIYSTPSIIDRLKKGGFCVTELTPSKGA